MRVRLRVLLLGGTAEARALAAELHGDHDAVSSLAGRVPDPALPVGRVRVGGFGGVDGLRTWLHAERIAAVVDATHPFAARITANAVEACRQVGVPHVVLNRPPWPPRNAIVVGSDVEAADVVARNGYQRVFLTTGRSGSSAFTGVDAWFMIRAVTAPDDVELPPHRELLLSRGPYHYAGERKLLQDNDIDALVTKNSGGDMTRGKVDAAHDLGIPVIMVDRPALPGDVRVVPTVDAAAAWVRSLRPVPDCPAP